MTAWTDMALAADLPELFDQADEQNRKQGAQMIKFNAYVYWKKPYRGDESASENFHVFLSEAMEEYGYVRCGEPVELELPIPHFDPLKEQLRAIDAAEAKARADFGRRITELQRQKQELLAIEMEAA